MWQENKTPAICTCQGRAGRGAALCRSPAAPIGTPGASSTAAGICCRTSLMNLHAFGTMTDNVACLLILPITSACFKDASRSSAGQSVPAAEVLYNRAQSGRSSVPAVTKSLAGGTRAYKTALPRGSAAPPGGGTERGAGRGRAAFSCWIPAGPKRQRLWNTRCSDPQRHNLKRFRMHPEVSSRLTNGTALYSWATPPIAGGNGSRNAPPAAVSETGEVTSKPPEGQRPGRPAVPRGAGGARWARLRTRPCHAHAHWAGRGAAPDALRATPRAPRPPRHRCAARGLGAAATRPRCAGAAAAAGGPARHRGVTEGLRSRRAAAVPPRTCRHEDLDLGARIRVSAGRGRLRERGGGDGGFFLLFLVFCRVGARGSFPASEPLCPGRLGAGPSSDGAAAASPLLP